MFDLETLETLETPFDFGGQIFDVARALSEEIGQPAVDETGESTFETGCTEPAVLFRFITLGDVWDGRTREPGGDWGVLEGSVLGGGCGEIWPGVDWEAGRHLDEKRERRWMEVREKKDFVKDLFCCSCRRATRERKISQSGVSVFAIILSLT